MVSMAQGEYAQDLIAEFKELWNSNYAAAFEDFIEEYTLSYQIIRKQRKIVKETQLTSLEQYKLRPNSMQLGFISNLEKIRAAGETKSTVDFRNRDRENLRVCICSERAGNEKSIVSGAQRADCEAGYCQL